MRAELRSVALTLDRADEHLNSLKNEISTYLEAEPAPITLRSKFNRHRTQQFFHIEYREPIPDEFSIRIGECSHALRTALDQSVWAMSTTPHNATAFPVYSSRDKFFERSRKTKRPTPVSGMHKIAGVRPLAQAFIEKLQPYNGTHDGLLLAILNDLDVRQKHRAVTTTAMVAEWTVHEPIPGADVTRSGRAVLEDGAYFGRATYATPPYRGVDVRLGFSAYIGVPYQPPRANLRMPDDLDEIRNLVRFEIIEPLERLAWSGFDGSKSKAP